MVRLIARYQIKEDALTEVNEIIRKFISAVEKEEPQTVYDAYRLGDTYEFIHLITFPDESAQKKHQNAAYTEEFAEALYPHCVEEPKFTPLTIIE